MAASKCLFSGNVTAGLPKINVREKIDKMGNARANGRGWGEAPKEEICMKINKIWTAALVVSIVLSVGGVFAAENAAATSDRPQMSARDQAEKKRAFEERLSKLEEEFEKKHNKIRRRMEELEQEFRNCRKATPEEVHADFVRILNKQNRRKAEIHVKDAAAEETAETKSSDLPEQETVCISNQPEEQEKRDAFDKRFAEKKARFDKEYNEVKQQGEEIKKKFHDCRTPSEEELRIAKERRKQE